MTEQPPEPIIQTVAEAVRAQNAQRIAVFAAPGRDEAPPEWLPVDAMRVSACADLQAGRPDGARVDLALLTPDWLRQAADAGNLERELAALRDLHAGAVLAVAEQDAPLSDAGWRALGFTTHRRDARTGTALQGFNLYDYKQRPDWLNARNWANPELWDVYRW